MRRTLATVIAPSIVLLLAAAVHPSFAITAVAPSPTHAHDEASSVGKPGNAKSASRTVTVVMLDTMRFEPAMIAAKKGETLHFVVRNAGTIRHEMTLGSKQELKEHGDMMRAMPNMVHQDDNSVTVEPGKTGNLVWQFTRTGTFDFACLQPGHFEAGMKGTIAVK